MNWPRAYRPSALAWFTDGLKYTRSRSSFWACWKAGSLAAVFQSDGKFGSSPACESVPLTLRSAGRYFASTLPGTREVYSLTSSSMSPVPEQKPMIPAVYPRPSPMSSMYLYWAFQSSEEFSALDTSCIAMSFLCASNRSTCPFCDGDGDADGVVALGVGVE